MSRKGRGLICHDIDSQLYLGSIRMWQRAWRLCPVSEGAWVRATNPVAWARLGDRKMNHLRILAFAIVMLLCGCGRSEDTPEKTSADEETSTAADDEPAATQTDTVEDLPAARSVRPTEIVLAKPVDPQEKLRSRLAQIARDDLLVVRARVESMSVAKRKLPEALYWGPYPHIVTNLELRTVQTFCGADMESVSASYVGGRLPDGTVEMTELTPATMAPGNEHVFILRRVGDEYFLELGRDDMLRKNPDGRFVDAAARPVDLEYIREACP